ncbi:MAG: response regulator transcription factor [Actinomycetes bacterium]|uniref:Unannotated protein n=1 Tax=freshwater metagenome TaxID=449393 RepID=A0A6J7ED65_9ZZZZ|nr:hypothetical protein [Actinomycetota bacterium]
MPLTTIVVVDSLELFCAGFKALLETEPGFEVLATGLTLEDARRNAAGHQPDVVILGPNLSHQPTEAAHAAVLAAVREASPTSKLMVVLNTDSDVDVAEDGLAAGVDGLATLKMSRDAFITSIQRVVSGEPFIASSLSVAIIQDQIEKGKQEISARETDILTQAALGHTNAEIADIFHLSVRTVESHRAAINSKLDLTSRADLVRYAMREGLLFHPRCKRCIVNPAAR